MACIKKEKVWLKKREQHGERHTITYNSYRGMKERCLSKNHKNYNTYGEKGITVCQEWILSYKKFREDMGQRPSKDFTLDRIDNSKGYYKENCRWIHHTEQHLNMGDRKDAHYISLDGFELTVTQWAEFLGVNTSTLFYRKKRNWDAEKILTPPKLIGRPSFYD